jgi:hypothetical protein
MHHLVKAAVGYIERLNLSLIVAGANKIPNVEFFPQGVKSATQNVAKLERAIKATSGATLAARVGRHLVLDVDTRHGGHESLATIERTLGPLPKTWKQETPTGGLHFWFRGIPFDIKGMLATGVECLRANRLVTLAPSQRAGGTYKWIDHPLRTELAEPPDWLQRAIRREPAPERKSDSTEDPAVREKRARAWLAKANGAVQGQHGSSRTIAIAVIVVRGFDLSKDVAFSILSEWNQRCDPPWSDYELKRKIDDAHRSGRMEWGALLVPREARAA